MRVLRSACQPEKTKNDIKLKKIILTAVTALFTMAGFTSCSLVNDDLPECAPNPNTFTTVNFVYDYNMHYTDLFTNHVGSVYLYVFDNDGVYHLRRELHRSDMGGKVDFSMTFDTLDLKPGNTYQFVAVAQANHVGYEASQDTPGFTLQTEMIPGVSKIDDYILKLDRDDDGNFDFGVVDYRDAYGNTETMMDTIWTTKPDEVQIVEIPKTDYTPSVIQKPDQQVNVTIPMMRITNSIKVNLLSPVINANTSPDTYNVLIDFPFGNGTIDFTGNTQPAQELYYRALRKSVTKYGETKADPADEQYVLHAEFGVSRLQCADNSSLQIRDPESNEILAQIPDFSDFLAEYLAGDFDDAQEFLDREYDFQIDVTVDKDNNIRYVDLYLLVLGWHVRVQYTDL